MPGQKCYPCSRLHRIGPQQVDVAPVPVAERDHLQPRPQQLRQRLLHERRVSRIVQILGKLLSHADRILDGACPVETSSLDNASGCAA